ncbi:hypothetical protein AQ946_22610 [Burkholderia pseudomallei]|nr:hypothetical protein AQ732_25995 [Burkholderia pseudomallei]OMS40016.1 hypothetical protein AQ740_30035 [Burkholderia pseudomallei]OMS53150.1 hypothetical protein AQ743_06055 [Burkholderia pseudomallei]OMS60825.1 hypothetical protein AQ744_03350 [Burkholderia pseudomallei]OMS69313.1 hypothetical protein AQ745_13120 [Burkholderia pseudomallei]
MNARPGGGAKPMRRIETATGRVSSPRGAERFIAEPAGVIPPNDDARPRGPQRAAALRKRADYVQRDRAIKCRALTRRGGHADSGGRSHSRSAA